MSADTLTRFYEAEATCIHCGRVAGRLRSTRPSAVAGALFLPADGAAGATIRSLADRRCRCCGGPLYVEGFEPRYAFKPADIPIDQPRRGRPPAWLVAARRAAAAEQPAPERQASSA